MTYKLLVAVTAIFCVFLMLALAQEPFDYNKTKSRASSLSTR